MLINKFEIRMIISDSMLLIKILCKVRWKCLKDVLEKSSMVVMKWVVKFSC